MILRPYQTRAVANSAAALKKHDNTLLVGATGCGKTIMISATTKKIIGANKRALIVQHRDELTNQNADTFDQMFPNTHISFFNAQCKSWRGQVVFSMIQTLSRDRHLDRMPPVDFLVYDEAHHSASNSYRKLTARAKELNPKTKILGVTATPERADSKGLKETFGNVADIITIGEMVQGGYLVPPRGMVIDIGTQGALRAVKKTAQDYNMAEVEAIQNSIVLNKRIIEKWEAEAVSRPTVAFCATIKHALDVRDSFRDAGYVSEAISSNTPKKERKAILKSYDRGEIQLLANPMLLTEGWDCLDVKTEVLTPNGWKKYGELKKGYPVYGYNTNTAKIKECPILDIGLRSVRQNEKMLTIKSQHMNIRTTEGHRFFIKKNRRGTYKEIKARDFATLKSEYTIPLSGFATFDGIDLTNDEIRLLAWYITDSYLTKQGRLEIYQATHKESKHIANLLNRLGYVYKKAIRGKRNTNGFNETSPLCVFGIGKLQFVKVFPYMDKKISSLLDNMTRDQFQIFWKELLLGDGENKNKSGCLCTGLKQVTDRISQMAVLRGFASSVSVRKREKSISYRVFVRDKQSINSLPSDKRSARICLKNNIKPESVWCVTNKMGTLITRRKGKIAIIGNCQVCSCVMMLRISSHKSTMIQMIGRGLRKVDPRRYPGIIKTDCKVLDFGISLLNHGNLEADVNLRFDRQSDVEAAKKNCPMCNSELPVQAHVCPLCGYEFKILSLDEDFDELEEFKLIEIDILNNSPFRWISIFPSEKVLVTTGFGSWAAVVSKDGDNWFAIGNGQGKKTEVLTIANKIGAISSADDYMRANETSASSKKAAKWQNEPASLKQQQILYRMGYQENGFSKVEAACHLTFRFNQRKIEELIS